MKLVKSFEVPALPQQVGDILCSAAFNIAAERERPSVLDTRYLLLEERDHILTFELRSLEYRRKKTGGLDRSGTVESVVHSTFDARKLTLSWSYRGAGSRWVTAGGTYYLTPTPTGTLLRHEILVEVHIPLIGGGIARLISGEFDAVAQRFARLLSDQIHNER